jgi:hypothetical protein
MLYIRGPLGQCAVRFEYRVTTDIIICTVLNDLSTISIDRSTNALFLTGLKALDNKIVAVVGQPSLMSDIPDLV